MSFAPETASFKSKMPKILNENDAPDGALINSPKQGTIAGQGDVGGKHVPIRGMVSTHTSNDDPLLDVSHPLGRLPSYETGTPYVPQDEVAQLHEGEAVVPKDENTALRNLDGSSRQGDASMEARPSEHEQKQSLVQDDISQAQQKGDLIGAGRGLINENILNRGDASLEKRPTEQLPRVAGTESAAPEASSVIPKIGEPSASPDLIQTKPEMPAYIGTKRIGKGTAGEAELKDERETKIDHLKYTMANGSREEAANAQEQLARLEQGTPWGSPSNHAGILGKIGHIAARIGEGALDAYAGPEATATLIPGSKEGLAAKESQGIGKIKELGAERLQDAQVEGTKNKAEVAQQKLALDQEKVNETAEKNATAHADSLSKLGYKVDASGKTVPLTYEEMSPLQQAKVDIGHAQEGAAEAKAAVDRYKVDPNSVSNQMAMRKVSIMARNAATAAGHLGIDQARFVADYFGTDTKGNPLSGVDTTEAGAPVGVKVGKGGANATLQTKAVQARNVQDNLNQAIDLINKNPDLFGKVSGRFTTASQMIGSDDPAIARLGNIIHNAAMASNSVHGLRRSPDETSAVMLNHFRNSPKATIAGLQDTVDSMNTFVNAGLHGAKAELRSPTKNTQEAPKGATNEVYGKDGHTVAGHIVNGKYVPLTK